MPIQGADVRFAEAGKILKSDANGAYSLRTNEGQHTLVTSAIGFLPDTSVVEVVAGPDGVEHTISLAVNTAVLDVSVDSFEVELEVGGTTQESFVISNAGGGLLNFEVRDITGPFEGSGTNANSNDFSFQPGWDIAKIKQAATQGAITSAVALVKSLQLEQIIDEPAGDLVGDPSFSKPDIIGLFADFDAFSVTFQFVFNDAIVRDSTLILLSLDTDQGHHNRRFSSRFGNRCARNTRARHRLRF